MKARMHRLTLLLVGLALAVAACSTDDPQGAGSGGRATEADLIEVEQVASTDRESVPSALDDPTADDLPQPLVDMDRVISGGPPPDGIPSIERPRFHETGDVDFLEDDEPVIAVELNGDARAYPVQILTWHEIVNDTIGGDPVTVTYCPLCNSAIVMYDRQTESLWSHFNAEAIAGILTGEELDRHPTAMVGWAEWRDANPGGLVLSRKTGHDREYGRNPYTGYDDIDQSPFLFDGEADGRLRPMTRIVGLRDGEDSIAVQLDDLLEDGVVEVALGEQDLVVWAKPGTASALDASEIADGRDVGTTGAFVPEVNGERLRFERAGDGFRDEETGSSWNVLGEAVDGPHVGERLRRFTHVDTFWFAWAAFLPDTEVVPPVS